MMDEVTSAEHPTRRTHRAVWVAIGVLSILGVVQSMLARPPVAQRTLFDERRFRLYATNLADRGFFGDEAGKWPATVELRSVPYKAYLPPGYPFFLAAFRTIVGGFRLVHFAQALIVGATIALASWVGLRLFGPVGGIAAGVVLLATGVLSTYSQLTLSEVLAAATLTASIAVLIVAIDRRSWILALGAGLMLGVAALVRPQVLLLPIPLGVWAFFAWDRRRAGAVAALAIVAGTIVAVAPWTARNYSRLNAFVPLSTYTWVNFWMVNNPDANGQFRLPERWLGVAKVRQIRALPEVEQDVEWRRLALRWMRSDPGGAMRGWIRNGRIYLTEEDVIIPLYYGYRGHRPPRLDERLLAPIALTGLLVALAAGLLDRRVWPVVLVVVYFIAFFCLFLPDGRYRVPMLPMLAVLSGALPAGIWRLMRGRSAPPPAQATEAAV
jgi:4-amino-4-deoxy-L-arabinose transferase-like glycosyltransferase